MTLSGYELSSTQNESIKANGTNALGYILIIPSAAILLLSLFLDRIKKTFIYNLCKMIYYIVPIFNVFAVFIIRHALKVKIQSVMQSMSLTKIPLKVDIKFGFVCYIICNAVVFVFAVMDYFKERREEPKTPHE